MLLFDNFKAVKFDEENEILISDDDKLKYIYYIKQKIWKKYKSSLDNIKDYGWESLDDKITTKNYSDIDSEQIIEALEGKFPRSEIDILRLCVSSSLDYKDYFRILLEDYRKKFFYDLKYDYYNSDLYKYTNMFLSNATSKIIAYKMIDSLFEEAKNNNYNEEQIINNIKKLSKKIIERDIYNEIGITDGYDPYSGFWLMPAKTVYKIDTDEIDNIYPIESNQISIDFDNPYIYSGIDYLLPFLIKYYDNCIPANVFFKNQIVKYRPGGLAFTYNTGNYYSLESIEKMIKDIKDTIDALCSGIETEYTKIIKEKKFYY